jgi:hypothetical protein
MRFPGPDALSARANESWLNVDAIDGESQPLQMARVFASTARDVQDAFRSWRATTD